MLATMLFHRAREIESERVQETERGTFEVGSVVVKDGRNVQKVDEVQQVRIPSCPKLSAGFRRSAITPNKGLHQRGVFV